MRCAKYGIESMRGYGMYIGYIHGWMEDVLHSSRRGKYYFEKAQRK